MKPTTTSVLAICLLLSACVQGTLAPSSGVEPEILLHVTGGIAGVDYTLLVDGPQREVVGKICVNGCDFEADQILHGLTDGQVESLADLFIGAGIHELDGTDFGEECCDQFHYDLSYTDRAGTANIRGTSEAIPLDLREAISVVAGFGSGFFPIVVDQGAELWEWPQDPIFILEAAIRDDYLEFQVSHGGGCATHHYDLVAFGGWMESDPVQIRAFFSHDGNGDPCDALITRELSFDLRPLKEAYQESYGVGEAGNTTLIISLNPVGASSFLWPPFEYIF
jgi:hypothetical protein